MKSNKFPVGVIQGRRIVYKFNLKFSIRSFDPHTFYVHNASFITIVPKIIARYIYEVYDVINKPLQIYTMIMWIVVWIDGFFRFNVFVNKIFMILDSLITLYSRHTGHVLAHPFIIFLFTGVITSIAGIL